jgi:hypothetical protein
MAVFLLLKDPNVDDALNQRAAVQFRSDQAGFARAAARLAAEKAWPSMAVAEASLIAPDDDDGGDDVTDDKYAGKPAAFVLSGFPVEVNWASGRYEVFGPLVNGHLAYRLVWPGNSAVGEKPHDDETWICYCGEAERWMLQTSETKGTESGLAYPEIEGSCVEPWNSKSRWLYYFEGGWQPAPDVKMVDLAKDRHESLYTSSETASKDDDAPANSLSWWVCGLSGQQVDNGVMTEHGVVYEWANLEALGQTRAASRFAPS